jgi:hypothetical protein
MSNLRKATKIILKQILQKCGYTPAGSRERQMPGCCECSNEPQGTTGLCSQLILATFETI